MKSLLKIISKKEFIIPLICSSMAAITGWLLQQFTPFKVWSWLSILFSAIIRYLHAILLTTIPLWGILLLFIILLAITVIVVKIYCIARKRQSCKFLDYKEAIYEKVKYRWKYKRCGKLYTIINIKAYCGECSCELVGIECPKCKISYLNKLTIDHVQALIKYDINTKFNEDEYELII